MKNKFTYKELEALKETMAPNAFEARRYAVWSETVRWITKGFVQVGPDLFMDEKEWEMDESTPLFHDDIQMYRVAKHESGYRYLVRKNCTSWTAFRTIEGVKRFLSDYGLTAKLHTRRKDGFASFHLYGDKFEERMLWGDSWHDIPANAKTSYRLSNGDYTEHKIYKKGRTTILAHLNPNVIDRKTIPHFHE